MLGVVLELQFSKARIQDLELSCVCFSNQSSYEWGLIALNKNETLNNLLRQLQFQNIYEDAFENFLMI